MADFLTALPFTLANEGGYSNNPNDSGGETMMGITEATARDYGYEGDMADLDEATVAEIYRAGYWDTWSLDEIQSQGIATAIFDLHVNMGGNAAGVVQDALLAIGVQVDRDNRWGPATRHAVNQADPSSLIAAISAAAADYYTSLAERRPQNQAFLSGWLNRAEALGNLVIANPGTSASVALALLAGMGFLAMRSKG